jgi:hypothetical protein
MDMDRILNNLFPSGDISPARRPVKPAELSKSCGLVGVLDGRVGAARRSQVRAGLGIAPLGRTQSERRRRLALAGGFSVAQIVWNRSTRRAGARGGREEFLEKISEERATYQKLLNPTPQ